MKNCVKNAIALGLYWASVGGVTAEATQAPFSEPQITALKQMFHDYIVNNPEVLIEASQSLQQKQQKELLARAQAAIPEQAKPLFQSKSPSIGNVTSTIQVVTFFDYQCHHCRDMYAVIEKLKESNKDLKITFKEFPLFGEVSEFASKMALAANKQNKYFEFHGALMKIQPPLSIEKIKQAAVSLKLDMAQLTKDMEDASVVDELQANVTLAQSLGVMGTPAFVIAGNVGTDKIKSFYVPGAASLQTLQKLIQQASGALSEDTTTDASAANVEPTSEVGTEKQ